MSTKTFPGSQAPAWAQTLHYTARPLEYMAATWQRYGDLFNASVIGNYLVVLFVSHPKALQQVFSNDAKERRGVTLAPERGGRMIFQGEA